MKTIILSQEILTKWLTALRSGEYKQCSKTMCDNIDDYSNAGFCCLGVLEHVMDGEVEKVTDGYKTIGCGVPSKGWCEKYNIIFKNDKDKIICNAAPYLPKLKDYAASANDLGKTFAEIADAIEDCAEGI